MKCPRCGMDLSTCYGNRKYCAECAEIIHREKAAQRAREKRKPPSPIKCAVCGRAVERTGNCQKYCVECRQKVRAARGTSEKARAYGRAYYWKNRDAVNAWNRRKRRALRGGDKKMKCAVCGKEFAPKNSWQKYCTRACYQKAAAERSRERHGHIAKEVSG